MTPQELQDAIRGADPVIFAITRPHSDRYIYRIAGPAGWSSVRFLSSLSGPRFRYIGHINIGPDDELSDLCMTLKAQRDSCDPDVVLFRDYQADPSSFTVVREPYVNLETKLLSEFIELLNRHNLSFDGGDIALTERRTKQTYTIEIDHLTEALTVRADDDDY